MTTTTISPELLDRYNRPGPRYTSYPTVPYWSNAFGEEAYHQALANLAERPDEPLSLYVHLPFCSHRCYYCGCNATVTNRPAVVDAYLDRVEHELELVLAQLGEKRRVVQLHWGGGTPNFLTPEQMTRLFRLLATSFEIDRGGEISLEIDPRIGSREQLACIRELGFNRISLGVQDFDPMVQQAIGRIQPETLTRDLYATCRELAFESVNLDLVYGLPGQTAASYERTLREIIALAPDRVACFSYAHLPQSRANQKLVDTTHMPNHYEKFSLFQLSVELFTASGYDWIGMDHFAKQSDELAVAARERRLHRNFMGYTIRPAPHLLALGMSGIGEVAGCFVQNDAHLGRYQKIVDAGHLPIVRGMRLSDEDRLRRRVILHLMCNLELPYALTLDEFGVRVTEHLSAELERLQPYVDEGFLTYEPERIAVTSLGRYFIRNISMEFDSYLKQGQQRPLFSKTI